MVVHVVDFSRVSGDSNKLNPLGRKLRHHIWSELRRAQSDSGVTSIVLTGGPRSGNFSAGADLTEFAEAASIPSLQAGENTNTNTNNSNSNKSLIDVVNLIEACDKPVVACIEGACLGGGLEVALACHYRVALNAESTQLGLPEVHVGVIPGAGGTQRLPRLIGLQRALPLILTGAPVAAQKALQLQLVDAVVDPSVSGYAGLLEAAQQWARWAEVLPLEGRRLSLRSIPEPPPVAHAALHAARLGLPSQGSSGVRAALEACRAASWNDFALGMQREGELFWETLASPEGRARRHAFFAVRQAQKPVHNSATNSSDAAAALSNHPLLQSDASACRTAVIGAGTMGGGIALVLLRAGYRVTLVDVSPAALDKGLAQIRAAVQSWVRRGTMAAGTAQELLAARLSSATRLDDLRNGDCRLVVEAVVENLQIKRGIFRALDRITPPDCVLLSNTSTLDLDRIMDAVSTTARPVAGWHFFSPAPVMRLVEIVASPRRTAPETVSLLQALTKRVGKIGVVVGNCDGFCGNRLLRPYSAEMVLAVVEHDNSIQDVDRAMLQFGMALGPYQMADLAGNDIGYNIRRERGWVRDKNNTAAPENRPARYTELGDDMVTELGRLGQKAGKGWYDYDPAIGKGRKALPSPEMDRFCQRYRHPGSLSKLSDDEIVERLLYPLVNEGFKCLEEGIARSPGDIDVVYLYGYGWPAWRGGPMYWADHCVGLDVLLSKLQDLSRQFPETDHFVPSQLLVECVRRQVTVQEYYETATKQSKKQSARSKL